MKYYCLLRNMSSYNLRLSMVKRAKATSISEASRYYGTTRKTVRKWVGRYDRGGLSGLKDLSRAPHHIPHKMDKEEEERVVELRKQHQSWGARRLKERYGLRGSYTAIHRVIRQYGLVRKKRRRWRKRKDLSRLKQRMRLFEQSQVDTKDLSDIYQYWPYMRNLGLPRYQYTLRELSTGAAFYAYANRNTSTNASLFARYVVAHLGEYGIDGTQMRWQTDNGSEYIGQSMKRINRQSAFEKVLSKQGITHGRIPPRASYLQGDVETFHRICEDELYDIESYDNGIQFYGKAYAYQLYFNHIRKNRYRDNRSPLDILKERFPDAQEGIFNLPPINLELLFDLYYNPQAGYHVPKPARRGTKSC
jgi:transposase